MVAIRSLQVTYKEGKPYAAYLYLPRIPGDKSVGTKRHEAGLLVDFAADGRPLGVEITAPRLATLEVVNRVLADIHQPLATAEELAPLLSARQTMPAVATA